MCPLWFWMAGSDDFLPESWFLLISFYECVICFLPSNSLLDAHAGSFCSEMKCRFLYFCFNLYHQCLFPSFLFQIPLLYVLAYHFHGIFRLSIDEGPHSSPAGCGLELAGHQALVTVVGVVGSFSFVLSLIDLGTLADLGTWCGQEALSVRAELRCLSDVGVDAWSLHVTKKVLKAQPVASAHRDIAGTAELVAGDERCTDFQQVRIAMCDLQEVLRGGPTWNLELHYMIYTYLQFYHIVI